MKISNSDVDWDAVQLRVQERIEALRQASGDLVIERSWDTPEEFMFSGTLVMLEVLGCRRAQLDLEVGDLEREVLQEHMVNTLTGVPESALKAIIDNMATMIVDLENKVGDADV